MKMWDFIRQLFRSISCHSKQIESINSGVRARDTLFPRPDRERWGEGRELTSIYLEHHCMKSINNGDPEKLNNLLKIRPLD